MRAAMVAMWLAAAAFPVAGAERPEITIGSKKFTESVILGEIVAHLDRAGGADAVHRRELGGTRVLWQALVRGDIDAYVEYTGTIAQEILAGRGLAGHDEIRAAVAAFGIAMGRPLGFNNTYAIGLRKDTAAKHGLAKISDLARHPALRFGFGNEFMDRGDGWPSLRERYGLPQRNVRGLDHDLAYRGLEAGDIDAMDVYTTDAEIAYYDLHLLVDDLGHFPRYHAVVLTRADLAGRAPGAVAAIARLAGRIDAARMSAMNALVKLDKVSEQRVAADPPVCSAPDGF